MNKRRTLSQELTTPEHTGASFLFDNVSFRLPNEALTVLKILEEAGYEAWFVGGYVRDSIQGKDSHDFDLTTSALPEQSKEALRAQGLAVYETGIKHGTITAILNDIPFEITTYRSDGTYTDQRHPDAVRFVTSIEEDLARRDFTCNALAFHPIRGIIDPYNGLQDIKDSTLRCVGCAKKRFEEDALRILRALRFASCLNFSLEPKTEEALFSCKDLLDSVAAERLFAEMEKLLCGSNCKTILLDYVDILGVFLPELLAMKGFDQKSTYHIYDVLEHSAWAVHYMPVTPLGRWAALCHDMGKPDVFILDDKGYGHMAGHAQVSVTHVKTIAKRLKFPKKLTHDVELLVCYHDTYLKSAPTKRIVRKLYRNMEEKEYLFHTMCDLMRADNLSKAPQYQQIRVEMANELEEIFNTMMEEEACFGIKDLPLSGHDLIELGFSQGPEIGQALSALLEAVVSGEVPATKEALSEKALQMLNSK